MASGVTVADDCISAYNVLRSEKRHRFIVFHIVDNQITVDQIGDRGAGYDDFLEQLKVGNGKECRYGVYDYEYEYQHQGTSSATIKQKLFLILWCPDTALTANKMLYAASYEALKQSLIGIQKYIQANDYEEASQESVEEILRSTDRN